jgi:hypothetical protein
MRPGREDRAASVPCQWLQPNHSQPRCGGEDALQDEQPTSQTPEGTGSQAGQDEAEACEPRALAKCYQRQRIANRCASVMPARNCEDFDETLDPTLMEDVWTGRGVGGSAPMSSPSDEATGALTG